jgi:PleD family two-component response regulator
VTISAGVAAARVGVTLDTLLQTADLALYRAKLQGRNRVEVDSPPEDANRAAVERQVA